MKYSLLSLLYLGGISLLFALPCRAQIHYHYSYGGTRVIQQDRLGLPNPSPTYMQSDVLSPSATGQSPNRIVAPPGPPGTYMGSSVSPTAHGKKPNNQVQDAPRPKVIPQVRQSGHYYETGQNGNGTSQYSAGNTAYSKGGMSQYNASGGEAKGRRGF